MNQTIIVPVPRSPTTAELIREQADRYSPDEKLQQAFRDGAHWWNDRSGGDLTTLIVACSIAIYCFVQLVCFGIGMADTSYRVNDPYQCELRGKWVFVIPAYEVGCHLKRWLDQ